MVAEVGECGDESNGVESGESGLEAGMEEGRDVTIGCMAHMRREEQTSECVVSL